MLMALNRLLHGALQFKIRILKFYVIHILFRGICVTFLSEKLIKSNVQPNIYHTEMILCDEKFLNCTTYYPHILST